MSKGRDALVVGAIRSPIGSGRTKDSDFKDLSPQDLALQVLDVSFKRTNMPKEAIQVYRVGSVVSLKSDKFTQAPAREIALRAGMFNASSGISEKACSSGLRAVYEASEAVRHGGVNFAIGAGLDMMSNAPAGANSGALTCPLTKKSMAELSDLKARELGFTRYDYDLYAFESFKKAKKHLCDYSVDGYIAPVSFGGATGPYLNTDQNVNFREMTQERMQNCGLLRGCQMTTPYNSSKFGDAYAQLTFASPGAARKYGLPVLAKLLAYAEHTERESKDFICGPVGAVIKAVKKAKKTLFDIDSWWINEAFPGSPLYFIDKISEALWEDVNPWGGAIAFGHALGATGAVLCVNAICQTRKEGKKYVVVSLCNAIGEATAAVFEIV